MKTILATLTLLGILVSCAKKVDPIPQGPYQCRINSMNDSLGKPIYKVNYDDHGFYKELVQVDSNGKIIQTYTYENNLLKQRISNPYLVSYNYNSHNQIDTIFHYLDSELLFKTVFQYQQDGMLSSRIVYGSNSDGTFYISDSDTYSDYYRGRPLKQRKFMMNKEEVYENEYDDHMNRTKQFLIKDNAQKILIMESTFDKSVETAEALKFILHLEYEPSEESELYLINKNGDPNLATQIRHYNEDGSLKEDFKVTNIVKTHQNNVKSFVSDNVIRNFTYNCE